MRGAPGLGVVSGAGHAAVNRTEKKKDKKKAKHFTFEEPESHETRPLMIRAQAHLETKPSNPEDLDNRRHRQSRWNYWDTEENSEQEGEYYKAESQKWFRFIF